MFPSPLAEAFPRKVVLTCAVTGALADRRQCPAIPYTPAEIAEECRRAWEAGAAVVHVHAREEDGTPTSRPEVFERIVEEVRRRCPVLINLSTGTLEEHAHEPIEAIRRVRPDIAALNMGTMNYAKYSRRQKRFVFEMVFPNPFSKILALLEAMAEAGVKPELECFDVGHTASSHVLLQMGALRPPIQYSFVLGVLGGLPATLEGLQLQARTVPPGHPWEVIAIGRPHWPLLAASLLLGGHVRTGLEDHLYLPDGSMASGNGPMVEAAVRLVRAMGCEPASVEEARELLGLGAQRADGGGGAPGT